MTGKLLDTHVMNMTPQNSSGESLCFVTKFFDNGDGEIYTNQSIKLASYYNECCINLSSESISSENLRKLADELDAKMANFQKKEVPKDPVLEYQEESLKFQSLIEKTTGIKQSFLEDDEGDCCEIKFSTNVTCNIDGNMGQAISNVLGLYNKGIIRIWFHYDYESDLYSIGSHIEGFGNEEVGIKSDNFQYCWNSFKNETKLVGVCSLFSNGQKIT